MLAEERQKLFERLCSMNDEDLQSLWESSEVRAELAKYQRRFSNSTNWNSVNERLPKENTLVLVYYDGHFAISEITVRDIVEGSVWSNTELDGKPSHWMPLPKPPNMLR